MGMNKKTGLAIVTIAALMTGGCATTTKTAQMGPAGAAGESEDGINDPMEGFNRAVFNINDGLDEALFRPVASGYRAVVPQPARTSVRNFLRNLRSPVNVANQLLQGDIEGVAHDLSRFVINTSIGIGGLFDVAETAGLDYEQEDFGQTMAVWGMDHGAYMVLPVIGPSSVRDTVGFVVDSYADPVRIYLENIDEEHWNYVRWGATALDKREELLDALADLRRNSFDYYAAVRSAYHQRRIALVNDNDPGDFGAPDIPDYDAGEE